MSIHTDLLEQERKAAQYIEDCLNDAEEIGEQLLKLQQFRQRRIEQVGRVRALLLKLRFRLSDFSLLLKHEITKIRDNG